MLKGALVSLSSVVPLPSLIRFQYNPAELTREVTPAFLSGEGASKNRVEPARFVGAPKETISLKAMVDASDSMAAGSTFTKINGIRPQLAALELFAYPSLIGVAKDIKLLDDGTVGAVSVPAARTLLIFGMTRIVPIRITSISVTEQLFDSNLNPIRAEVTLKMDVVSYSQSSDPKEPLSLAFVAYQGVLEAQALALKAQEALWLASKGAQLAGAAMKALK